MFDHGATCPPGDGFAGFVSDDPLGSRAPSGRVYVARMISRPVRRRSPERAFEEGAE